MRTPPHKAIVPDDTQDIREVLEKAFDCETFEEAVEVCRNFKPKPTAGEQEWTEKTVEQMAENCPDDKSPFIVIADAHNASRASAVERGQQESDRLDAFWQNEVARQLTEDRKKRCAKYEDLIHNQERTIQQLREQLATDVESVRKFWQETYNTCKATLGAERERADQAEQGELNEARKLAVAVEALKMLEYDDAECPLAWPSPTTVTRALAKIGEKK